MNKITYQDKVDTRVSTLPEINKTTASTHNEVKTIVNETIDQVELNVAELASPIKGTITTTTSITIATLTDNGDSQEGKVVAISNGVNNINYTLATGDYAISFIKLGTGTITFLNGTGTTIVSEGVVLNGAVGSQGNLTSFSNTFYISLNNI